MDPKWIKKRRDIDDYFDNQSPPPKLKFSTGLLNGRNEKSYESSIKDIELEYERRLQELEIWRQKEVDAIKKQFTARRYITLKDIQDLPHTTIDFPCENQFTYSHGKTACTAISLLMAYLFIYDTEKEATIWKYIIKAGSNLWKMWKERADTERNFIDIEDLKKLEIIQTYMPKLKHTFILFGFICTKEFSEARKWFLPRIENMRLHWNKEDFSTHSKDNINDLSHYYFIDEAIEYIYSIPLKIGIVFTIRDNSISILLEKEEGNSNTTELRKCKLFDSHGGIELQKSTLISFNEKNSLLKYLQLKYPLDYIKGAHWTNDESKRFLEDSANVNGFIMEIIYNIEE